MRRRGRVLIVPCLAFLIAALGAPPHLFAQADKATPADRAAIAACLDLVGRNQTAAATAPDYPPVEQPGASPRLKAAAAQAPTFAESCIGAVANACAAAPEGQSTIGMVDCSTRELAVWDERLNKSYQDAIAAAEPKLRDALQKAERAWIADRDARCALPALQNAGGTIVGPLTTACLMDATARQALWFAEAQ